MADPRTAAIVAAAAGAADDAAWEDLRRLTAAGVALKDETERLLIDWGSQSSTGRRPG